jgi:hypothetical protein
MCIPMFSTFTRGSGGGGAEASGSGSTTEADGVEVEVGVGVGVEVEVEVGVEAAGGDSCCGAGVDGARSHAEHMTRRARTRARLFIGGSLLLENVG